MKSIILAAGFATRLYPLTLNKPKALLNVKGRPIINHILDKIGEIPSEETIIITNNFFFNDFLEWKKKWGYEKTTIINDNISSPEKKLGAIGDLLFLIEKKKINDDLFVICGDNLFSYSLKEPFEIFKKEKKDLSIFFDTKDIDEAKRLGVALIKNNLLYDFEEKPENPKSTICSSSTYFFREDTIPFFRKFVTETGKKDQPGMFLEYLHKKIPIYAYLAKGNWIDIGTKEALERANKI